ncbi:hypothetical protein E4U15_001211 [Claviceps sp. LM218 group G6]|nr:hypothetical protein E4U15_001211 [Claviceps sp. LM218 group G6]
MINKLIASNGPEIAKVTKRKPRVSAKFSPLIVAVDGVETANRLCDTGIVYESEIFDAMPYNAAVNPRQCYRCCRVRPRTTAQVLEP